MPPFPTALPAVIALSVLLHPVTAAADDSDPRQRQPLVRLAAAEPAAGTERALTGVVTARVQSALGFRVAGKVVERLVDAGTAVRAGQPLMRLDPQDLALERAAREKAVAAAQALADQAAAEEARYKALLRDGWASRQRYEQAEAALRTARAGLAAAKAEAEVARNATGYAVLLADADGTVVETLAEAGQVVAAGQPVVTLAHAGPREALVDLPETVRPAIGAPAWALVYGAAARAPARLRQLSDAADPASRTYEARYVLEGEAARAPLGATVTLWTGGTGQEAAVSVPLGALHDDGRTTGVWLVDPQTSTVSLRPVRVQGLTEEAALVEGIGPGTRVVALGAHLLRPGDRVRLPEERSAAR